MDLSDDDDCEDENVRAEPCLDESKEQTEFGKNGR